jgi:hypothetical protein
MTPDTFKRFLRTLASWFLFLSFATAQAKVVEMNSMQQALSHVDEQTLVVLDLDNTVFEATQMLGSDQFFSYLVKLGTDQGLDLAAAKDKALEKASFVQPMTRVRPVESSTPLLVKALQDRGYKVMALTSRPGNWAQKTLLQVASVHIDFERTSPHLNPQQIAFAGLYQKGVLFLAKDSNKGAALLTILKFSAQKFQRVLFVDDKASNVESVEKALDQTTLQHLSVRYGAADRSVAMFDPAIAKCQWAIFRGQKVFLNDDGAKAAIAQRRCL